MEAHVLGLRSNHSGACINADGAADAHYRMGQEQPCPCFRGAVFSRLPRISESDCSGFDGVDSLRRTNRGAAVLYTLPLCRMVGLACRHDRGNRGAIADSPDEASTTVVRIVSQFEKFHRPGFILTSRAQEHSASARAQWAKDSAATICRSMGFLAGQNRVGGGVTPAVLPHHRTCGSASGGSSNTLESSHRIEQRHQT